MQKKIIKILIVFAVLCLVAFASFKIGQSSLSRQSLSKFYNGVQFDLYEIKDCLQGADDIDWDNSLIRNVSEQRNRGAGKDSYYQQLDEAAFTAKLYMNSIGYCKVDWPLQSGHALYNITPLFFSSKSDHALDLYDGFDFLIEVDASGETAKQWVLKY